MLHLLPYRLPACYCNSNGPYVHAAVETGIGLLTVSYCRVYSEGLRQPTKQ